MNSFSDALLTFRGIQKYRQVLCQSDRVAPSAVRDQQAVWLKELLTYAHQTIPWYQEQFRLYDVRSDADDPFAELSKLPILTKQQVLENHADFCAPGVAKNALKFTTSGTTGEPLIAYTSSNQWLIEQACIWRQWKWADYHFRDRMAIFRSYAPKVGQPQIRVDHLRNWAYFSVFKMDDGSLTSYAKFLRTWKPRFLRGYPSSLLLVAQHALRYGWCLPSLKAAFVASEKVSPIIRETLHRAFGIELFDHYGQAEITCMFHDCEKHEGMHVDWEYGYVELIPSETPDLSKLIATNLHNKAMPLLRYDTGDLACGDWEVCSCGRVSPILRSIHGRIDDFLIGADYSRMPTVNIYTYFSKLDQVRRFQVIQSKPGEVDVLISLWGQSEARASHEDELEQNIRRYFLEQIGISAHILWDASWRQSREGKFPAFIQRIPT